LHKLKPAQEERRSKMAEELTSFANQVGGTSASNYVEYILHQIGLTEAALEEINETVDADDYSSLSLDKQAWAALNWALSEMLDIHRQMQENLAASRRDDAIIIDPLTLRVDAEHGYGLGEDSGCFDWGQSADCGAYVWVGFGARLVGCRIAVVYALIFSLLLFLRRYNGWSLDGWMARS